MKPNRFVFLICLASCTVTHTIGTDALEQALACGGHLGCAAGYTCIDKPGDACDPNHGGTNCPSVCAQLGTACGGIAAKQCPSGESCIDDASDSCDPNAGGEDCPGVCVTYESGNAGGQQCGGFVGLECPSGERCVDDPTDNCDPNHGGADCPGICVTASTDGGTPDGGTPDAGTVEHCGGFAGFTCPGGEECIDDPSDNCDPAHGGADCPGVCSAISACGADPCGACPSGTVADDSCAANGAWQCACLDTCLPTVAIDCSSCPAALNHTVVRNGQCVCECAADAPPQCTQDSDCKASNPDICNLCAAPDNHLACKQGACVCGCQ